MTKAALLARLREDLSLRLTPAPVPTVGDPGGTDRWQLGPAGLAAASLPLGGMHEVAPELPAHWSSAAAVALRMLLRLPPLRAHLPVLWVEQLATVRERGALCMASLSALGLAPERLILVEAAKPAEALWALEEGARTSALAAVVAAGITIAFTDSRRLALACAATGVPLLHLPEHPAATSAALTRWRVSPRLSATDALQPEAVGPPRWQLSLVRARQGSGLRWPQSFDVEWDENALCFSLVSQLAHGSVASAADPADRRAA